MNRIKLTLKKSPTVVLEAEVITPDYFLERSNEEICTSVVYHGKREKRLDEFFDVEGESINAQNQTKHVQTIRWLFQNGSRLKISESPP